MQSTIAPVQKTCQLCPSVRKQNHHCFVPASPKSQCRMVTDTLPILHKKTRDHIKEHEEKLCEKLAREAEHCVLFQPPHQSDFQPIKLLWAKPKGKIGRQCNSSTAATVLKQPLDEEFEKSLKWHKEIGRMMWKAHVMCHNFHKDQVEDHEKSDAESLDNISGIDLDGRDDDLDSAVGI